MWWFRRRPPQLLLHHNPILSSYSTHPDHAEAVLYLLSSYGLPRPHIAKLLHRHPLLLTSRLDLLESKLTFLLHKGFSGADIGSLFSRDVHYLRSSLSNRIIPNYTLLAPVLGGEASVPPAVLKIPRLLTQNIQTSFIPNVERLRECGMDEGIILKVNQRALLRGAERFAEVVREVAEMGYDLSSRKSAMAISVLASTSGETWRRKVMLYRSLGFSEDDVSVAFRNNPAFLEVSDVNIRERVRFFVDKLGWSPAAIAAYPLTMLNLEKRVVPRCAVFNMLIEKGMIMEKVKEVQWFVMGKKKFFQMYVEKYVDKVPELLDAWEGRVEFNGFETEYYREPNLEVLRKLGLPENGIRKLEKKQPRVLLVNCVHLRRVIRGLKQMGFDIASGKFIDALSVLAIMPDSTSRGKLAFYRSLGWSDDEFVEAFKKQPHFVMLPDEQIKRIVNAFKNILNWSTKKIVARPKLLMLNLEKDIIPRCLVFKMLVSKGIWRKKRPGVHFFRMSGTSFLKMYVEKYKENCPELLEAYEGENLHNSDV